MTLCVRERNRKNTVRIRWKLVLVISLIMSTSQWTPRQKVALRSVLTSPWRRLLLSRIDICRCWQIGRERRKERKKHKKSFFLKVIVGIWHESLSAIFRLDRDMGNEKRREKNRTRKEKSEERNQQNHVWKPDSHTNITYLYLSNASFVLICSLSIDCIISLKRTIWTVLFNTLVFNRFASVNLVVLLIWRRFIYFLFRLRDVRRREREKELTRER